MIQADQTMHDRVAKAIQDDLVTNLRNSIKNFDPVARSLPQNYRVGDIEDANVLIQNSLWLSVPLGQLSSYDQVISLQDRRRWAANQIEQIELIRAKFDEAACHIETTCI